MIESVSFAFVEALGVGPDANSPALEDNDVQAGVEEFQRNRDASRAGPDKAKLRVKVRACMLTAQVEYHRASLDGCLMEKVTLPGTDLVSSRLAFGSAGLMARLSRRESLRLLEVAHESGITHFDTARSYGYGEAESVLGDFLVHRRDQVTLTTKLGMIPPGRSGAIRAAKELGRFAARRAPFVRPLLRRPAQATVRHGMFDPAQARASLETSLRELRTEAVDILLLHECRPPDLETEGLLSFLEQAVGEGKIRHFGIGTDPLSTEDALRHHPEFVRVVQIPSCAARPLLPQLPIDRTAVITHSAVREGLPPLLELMRDEARRERWSRALLVDFADPGNIARMLLADALHSNPRGVALFFSTREDSIRANAALVTGAGLLTEQVREFRRLARETLSTRAAADLPAGSTGPP